MGDFESLLVKSGFQLANKRNKTYSLEIFNGYVLDLQPEYGSWSDVDSVVIRLRAKRFGEFMERIFSKSNAQEYSERVQLKNKDGYMGIATVIVEYEPEPAFFTANGEIAVVEFLERLSAVGCVEGIYQIFYFEKTNKLLAMLDGVWVQMFFMLESEMPAEKIELELKELPTDFAKAEKKDFNLESILTFKSLYSEMAK